MKLKTIIRWEQYQGRPFGSIDMTDENDMQVLLYCRRVCECGMKYSFDTYVRTTSNHALFAEQMRALRDEISMMSQFMQSSGESCTGIPEDDTRIGDIVSSLIVSGIDAHYAMEEMELCDIPLLLSAQEAKKKEVMEDRRLWTFLSILPHIDAESMKNGAKDLITFPWETPEEDAITEEDVAQFESFIENGKKILE